MATRETATARPSIFFATPPRVLIVEARFYEGIANELVAGAEAVLRDHGARWERVGVPGAFELPGVIAMAAASSTGLASPYDGYIALGCVIRGDTSHYDYVCGESARGLMDLSIRDRLAIGYGVLTVENEAQAWARARRSEQDKGGDVAWACLSMVAVRRRFGIAS